MNTLPKVKDKSKPKSITRPYLFFFIEFMQKRKNQNFKGGAAELSKECGALWKQMSDSDKKKYFDLTEQDKLRYQREIESQIKKSD